jgi:hypothetical protein
MTNRLMLFGEATVVYFESHKEHTLCEQNEEFECIKAGGI